MRQGYSHERPCLRLVSNMIRSIKLIGYPIWSALSVEVEGLADLFFRCGLVDADVADAA